MRVLQCALWVQMSITMMHIYFGVVDHFIIQAYNECLSRDTKHWRFNGALLPCRTKTNSKNLLVCFIVHLMKWLLHANYMASLMTIVSSVCLSLQFSRLKTLYNYDWFFEMKTCIFWAQLFWCKTLAKEKLPQVTWWKKILGMINATPWWQMLILFLWAQGHVISAISAFGQKTTGTVQLHMDSKHTPPSAWR